MAEVHFNRGKDRDIQLQIIKDGTLSFTTDTHKIYLDGPGNKRTEYDGRDLFLFGEMINDNKLDFPDAEPPNNSVSFAILTRATAAIRSDADAMINFNGGDNPLKYYNFDCRKHTGRNIHSDSIFAIYRDKDGNFINLGTLNAIDDGLIT